MNFRLLIEGPGGSPTPQRQLDATSAVRSHGRFAKDRRAGFELVDAPDVADLHYRGVRHPGWRGACMYALWRGALLPYLFGAVGPKLKFTGLTQNS